MNQEAYSFITGISEDFEQSIKKYTDKSNENVLYNMKWYMKSKGIDDYEKILETLNEELKEHSKSLNEHILNFKNETIHNTSELCEYIPRGLLCNFADYLIKLTALKQQISLDLETVSSESEILLITKLNCLKWVKQTEEII